MERHLVADELEAISSAVDSATPREWRDGRLKYDALVLLAGGNLARTKGNHVLLAEWAYEVDALTQKRSSRIGGVEATSDFVAAKDPQSKKDLRDEWNAESTSLDAQIRKLKQDAGELRGEFKFWLGPKNKSPANSGRGRHLLETAARRLAISNNNGSRTIIAQHLTSGSFSDFFECLSDTDQKILTDAGLRPPKPTQAKAPTPEVVRAHDAIRDISVHRNHKFKKPNISSNAVDQKFYFLDPHSAHIWRDVITKGAYNQYKHCSESLERFLGRKENENESSEWSAIWEKFLQSGNVDGAVMLGGGGLEKDINVIESLLKHVPPQSTVHYSIVDVSIYMLMDSISSLEEDPTQLTEPNRVLINPLIWDFTDLADARRKLIRDGKNIGWFLPGGTIGNLIETDFLASMKAAATPGDLLVIGMETWGQKDFYVEIAQFKAKYETPEVNRFLKIPLRAVWDDLHYTDSLSKSLESKKVNTVPDKPGYPNRYSDIHESITVEISIKKNFASGGDKFVLLTSTRYKEEKFIEAAEFKGFRHLASIPAPDNLNYKQLVFEFRPKDEQRC